MAIEVECSVNKCKNRAIARGYCGNHYSLWRRHGDPNISKKPPEFMDLFDKIENGCWIWKGLKDKDVYGRYAGKRAHRLSFEIYKGVINKGLCVCHTCDDPSCVNPGHLFAGTNFDNTNDMLSKNRQHTNLTHREVIEIISLRKLKVRREVIAKKFNIHVDTITRITKGRRWGHLKQPEK